eukprot:1190552-Prorocentrum_minimum.AAC.6
MLVAGFREPNDGILVRRNRPGHLGGSFGGRVGCEASPTQGSAMCTHLGCVYVGRKLGLGPTR